VKIHHQSNVFIPFVSLLLLLAGCEEPPAKIETTRDWQTHLQEAKLPADFVPAVSESVYVPIYSDIYFEDTKRSLLLAGTLSIRNIDPKQELIIKSIRYYDTQGKMLEQLLDHPVLLAPFGTAEVVVPRTHASGGSGANFVVDWMSSKKVHEPLLEAVMLSTGSSQSVSFTTRGVVIEHTEGKPAESK